MNFFFPSIARNLLFFLLETKNSDDEIDFDKNRPRSIFFFNPVSTKIRQKYSIIVPKKQENKFSRESDRGMPI
jgi:hypothetical protein